MLDPNLQDFYVRVARIEADRRKGFGFEAVGTLGRSAYRRTERKGFPLMRSLLVVVVSIMALKAAIHYNIGDDVYRQRVAELQAGAGFDRLGGYLMVADPATVWLSAQIATRLAALR